MHLQYAFQKTPNAADIQQDCGIIWADKDTSRYLFGIADGHGEEFGEFISKLIVRFILTFTETYQETLDKANIEGWFSNLFDHIEITITNEVLLHLKTLNFETKISFDEIIYFRRPGNEAWEYFDAGSTLILLAILNEEIFVANIGSGSAILSSGDSNLTKHDVSILKDNAMPHVCTFNARPGKTDKLANLILTMDHVATSSYEYARCSDLPNPPLQFLYDCFKRGDEYKPIFVHPKTSQTKYPSLPVKDEKGYFYINKEKEFGSLISTPDGLHSMTYTRSFGNKLFKRFGVTHKPIVHQVNLSSLFEGTTKPISLLIGSNGIFANWIRTYEKAEALEETSNLVIASFLCHTSCIDAVETKPHGAMDVMNDFMKRNECLGKKRDDASGVLIYLSKTTIPETDWIFEASVPDHNVYGRHVPFNRKQFTELKELETFHVTNSAAFCF